MILDAKHRSWLIVTLVAGTAAWGIYAWCDAGTPGGLTGGSRVGLIYGLLGAGCMIFAGLLSALRRVPHWGWLGARQWWLRGHIWLGLLSAVFILCHGHYRLGGPLETALWIVLLLTLATGIVGLWLQHVLPRALMTRIADEAPYEQIPHLSRTLLLRADELVDALCGRDVKSDSADDKGQLRAFHEQELRPFLRGESLLTSLLARPLLAEAAFARLKQLPELHGVRDQIAELESIGNERRMLADQERLHRWLHAWLLVHIPLSAALLVLGVVHAVSAFYY